MTFDSHFAIDVGMPSGGNLTCITCGVGGLASTVGAECFDCNQGHCQYCDREARYRLVPWAALAEWEAWDDAHTSTVEVNGQTEWHLDFGGEERLRLILKIYASFAERLAYGQQEYSAQEVRQNARVLEAATF